MILKVTQGDGNCRYCISDRSLPNNVVYIYLAKFRRYYHTYAGVAMS